MKRSKLSLLQSIVSILLCVSLLAGTTFAWFTDTESSKSNIIQSGKLDVGLKWADTLASDTQWQDASVGPIFTTEKWEPGFTDVKYLKLSNLGNLAFWYQLSFAIPEAEEGGNTAAAADAALLAEVIDVYYADVTEGISSREEAVEKLTKVGTLSDLMTGRIFAAEGMLLPAGAEETASDETVACIMLKMQESAGNEYMTMSAGEGFCLQVLATQYSYEYDSYGKDYDADAAAEEFPTYPGIEEPPDESTAATDPTQGNDPTDPTQDSNPTDPTDPTQGDNTGSGGNQGGTTEGNIPTDENGKLANDVILDNGTVVPAGAQLEEGATELTLTIEEKADSDANLQLGENDALLSLDVHIDGISPENEKPIVINLGEILPEGMNIDNVNLYHVEDGVTRAMDRVFDLAELDAHNEYYYDIETGNTTVAMATFSEVAMVANTMNAWKGNFDYSWYDASKNELTIANADQLAAFGAIVGGMNGQTKASFKDKTVKLIADINLGDAEASNTDKIFYPIGYYNSTGKYEKVSGSSVTSSVRSFEGTFDGQGHTIANFYQNTWEMFGDYNEGYSGTPNHYKDAMGLFGYVNGGTVKNLTVSNFSSDGEFTPTGVIAAYAAGDAKFENIAITNCNPRVYNTGNGGIIGIAGDTSAANDDHITLKNITVDNTNKISALWGSYDVACGGLVGMYRGNVDGSGNATGDTISFENCHVSAQMDVYNDVCANYQYYAYRYSGMIIGSVRHNTRQGDKTVPNTAGISAENCTVNFGTWNDYYYCELVANSLASYTHDHQFSRLTQVAAVDDTDITYLDGTTGTVPDSGRYNYVVVTGTTHATENATCYHFVDGAVWEHEDAGTETVNGVTGILKENNQHIYLEFKQLFTGYSWGVSSVGLEAYGGVSISGITEGKQEASVEKFTVNKDYEIGTSDENGNLAITIGDLFNATATNINVSAIQVSVTDVTNLTNPVTGEFVLNETDWTKSILTLKGYKRTGTIAITIQDYNFCKPTTATFVNGVLHVGVLETVDRFEVKLPNYGYIYRVGNMNTVALGSLFQAKDGATINSADVDVVITAIEGSPATGTFTSNASDWTKGTIKFDGTGLVKVTIGDKGNSKSVELELEVVDAVNATSAASAKSNNVVLLNDIDFSTIEVSNGYTLYGNGFKMEAKNDLMYDTMGVGFVTLKNGILDNVQIVCPNFSYAIVYNSQIKDAGNTAVPSDSSNDARGNVRSAVMVDGNSKILDSYVHGGRAAVFQRSGNLLIDNSTISGGAAANIHTISAQSITLRDTTLIQKPFQATVHNTNKVMGFSGLFECGDDGYSTPLYLEGSLIQDAWANEDHAQYVPSAASSLVENALKKTEYVHDINGKESLNLGFTFMPSSASSPIEVVVYDNRTDKEMVPYSTADISAGLTKAKVYSYENKKGTNGEFIKDEDYIYTPTMQGYIAPTLAFNDINTDRVFETKFNTSNNRWESTLTVNLDNEDYTFKFADLTAYICGEEATFTAKIEGSDEDVTNKEILLDDTGMTSYVLSVKPNTRSTKNYECYFVLIAKKTAIKAPEKVKDPGGEPLLLCASYNGDWTCAIPALEETQIKYYNKSEKGYVTLNLSDLTPSKTGKANGSNTYWEYKVDGEYSLKVTCGVIHDTKQIAGIPIVVNNDGNKMYFTVPSSTGHVGSGTSARTVTITYEFTDGNGQYLKFTKTWQFTRANYLENQYSFSKFVNSGQLEELSNNSSPCVTPDTLITLANGKQVRVDSLTGNEELLVWNLETGKLDSAPIMFVDSDPEAEFEIIHLYFSDGTDVKVIYEHGFWDYDLNRYVYLDRYAEQYIGHTFAKQSGNKLSKVKLTNVVLKTETTTAWSPVTAGHLCYFVNGMLSMPGGVGGLFNIFDVDPATMTYDYEAMAKDIETYGLYTYEEMNAIAPLTEDMFNAAGGAYLKVSIGKGNLTIDELVAMINRYSKYI